MNIANPVVSERLVQLKASGAAPVAAIMAIHLEFDLSLAEAKRLFALSPVWEREVTNGDRLHHELITSLSKEPKA